MPSLHVCEVIKSLDVGGAEVLLAERLRLAPRAGVRYTVVGMRAGSGEITESLRANDIDVVDLSGRPGPLRYLALVATVAGLRPDVVNVHSPLPASVLRPCLRLVPHRPRLMSTVHSVSYRRATAVVDRLTMGLDDRTVAVSPSVATAATTRTARRLVTRVHGVDVTGQRLLAADPGPLRAEFGIPPGAFAIVCVANLRPVKNHMLLVAAAEAVLRRRPDAVFLLAGDGPLRAAVAGEIKRRGIDGRVRLLGQVPAARRLVAVADLVVLSSRWEGLPVVVMEALAAGVPVVATAVGGVADLVRPGHNGLLVDGRSPDDLAAAICDAATPATHERLRAGASTSTDQVDLAATAAWFEHLYRELSARGPV